MSTTTIAAAHPMPAARVIRKTVIGMALLATASVGLYEGAGALTAHANEPHTTVSYASTDAIARTLSGAVHTPAKQGAFLSGADITSGNVVSVVVAVK